MSELERLTALADWKLLSGSHEFPGPQGGTCINEAALVVAGFPYKKITSASDMPACFSRPISALAIRLNDRWSDADRQKLLPFVVRLAGTADTPAIERERVDILIKSLINNVIARIMRRRGDETTAALCEAAQTREEVIRAARTAGGKTKAASADAYAVSADAADAASAVYAADAASASAYAAYASAAADAAYASAASAAYAAYACKLDREFFVSWGLGVLEAMLAIGNRAEPIETACVVERMERAKQAVRV